MDMARLASDLIKSSQSHLITDAGTLSNQNANRTRGERADIKPEMACTNSRTDTKIHPSDEVITIQFLYGGRGGEKNTATWLEESV